jgi:hypothetical protein
MTSLIDYLKEDIKKKLSFIQYTKFVKFYLRIYYLTQTLLIIQH